MNGNKSLGKKILRAMIILVIVMLLAAGTIFALSVRNASETLSSSNKSLSETIGSQSSSYISEQSQKRLRELAAEGKETEVRCEFCGKEYLFSPEELTALAEEQKLAEGQ